MRMTKLSFNLNQRVSPQQLSSRRKWRLMRRLTGKVGYLHRNRIILCHAVKIFGKEELSLTDLKNFAPVQINTLYGLDNVKDFYWLFGYDVINVQTGHIKKLSFHKRNYPYVTLETKDNNTNKKCLLHHILALAYINNDKFEVIEHLDDNPLNYDISNLKFSNQSDNLRRAFKNGHGNRTDKIFEVTFKTSESYTGTLKELSTLLGIPRQTLYCRYYAQTPGRKIQSVKLVPNSDGRSTD